MSLASLASASGVRTMGVAIRGDSTDLSRTLAKSSAEVAAWERTTTASAARWSRGWTLAAAGVTVGILAVAAGLTAAALGAVQFDRNMRNVNSLLLGSNAELAALSRNVLEISQRIPVTAEDLSAGLYDIASSGFAGAEGLMILENAARAATAGLSSTETSAGVITAALNAYGLSAASAADVSDILFSTVNYGVVSFDELASSLGDVVGGAAAAKVPLDDVGSAIATMTLSGIGANEATTSLSRLLQTLVQPGEGLATVYKDLGYESGAAALETKGLSGVMEDLRQATGGSVEAYLQLFPEIRAARGAFALASNEGETYARVQAKIGDETARQGATQTAFAEQMKSTSAQWSLFTANIRAASISVGTEVLPVFNELLGVMTPLAAQAVPALANAWQMMVPYLQQVKDIGGDVWEVLEAIYEAIAPIIGALAAVGAAVAGAGLEILLDLLKGVSEAATENKGVVVALAAAWATRFLPSIMAVVTGLGRYIGMMQVSIIMAINQRLALQGSAVALGAMNTNMTIGATTQAVLRASMGATIATIKGLGAAFISSGAASAVLAAGIAYVVYAAATAAREVEASVSEITGSASALDAMSLQNAITQLREVRDTIKQVEPIDADMGASYLTPPTAAIEGWNKLSGAWEQFTTDKKMIVVNDALSTYNEQLANATVNATALAKETGLSFSEIQKLAKGQGVDLTADYGTEEARAARDQLVAYLGDIEKQTGITTQHMAEDWQMSVEDMQAFNTAVTEAMGKASQAFQGANDVLGSWKPGIGVDELTDAIDAETEAYEDLKKARSDSKTTADQLDAAEERYADARDARREAEATKSAGTLEAWYADAVATSQAFSDNLDKAIQMGLDPAVVTKLLQQGPDQAGPIVQQMVADNSGAIIDMVNDAEAALNDVNQRVVEQARLTAIAVNSSTDELGKQLGDATNISSLNASGFTTKEIAEKLGLDESVVKDIASNFGIILTSGISGALTNSPYTNDYAKTLGLDSAAGAVAGNQYGTGFLSGLQTTIGGFITGSSSPVPSGYRGGGAPLAYASGGILPGYSPGRDVHRFYSPTAGWLALSGGESIMRPEFAGAVGSGWINKMNALARQGGVAAIQRAMSMPNLGGFANGTAGLRIQAVPVPVKSTHTTEAPMYVGTMNVRDPGEGRRVARRTHALNQIGGRRG